jgi:hypothetical protein
VDPARGARIACNAARAVERRARVAVDWFVPPRIPRTEVPPAVVACVYRRAGAPRVERLLDGVPASWITTLWALDEVAPSLASRTVGEGPGARFELLNRAFAAVPHRGRWLVVTDDDVAVRPSLASFLAVADKAGLDLAMPAHLGCSFHNHRITRRQLGSRVRTTTFVEIGPVIAVRPSWAERVVPFAEDDGLGWGAEMAWADLAADGCRLGIVDATPALHLVPPGRTYDQRAAMARLEAELDRRGVPGTTTRARIDGLQRSTSTWTRWSAAPPWRTTP